VITTVDGCDAQRILCKRVFQLSKVADSGCGDRWYAGDRLNLKAIAVATRCANQGL
jgi:hypothetical protein